MAGRLPKMDGKKRIDFHSEKGEFVPSLAMQDNDFINCF